MSRALAVTVPIPAASGPIAGPARCLRAISLCETAGATAKIRIWNNSSSASGVIATVVTFNPDESVRDRWDYGDVVLDVGCWVEVVSGTVEGSISLQAISPEAEHYRASEADLDEMTLHVELQG